MTRASSLASHASRYSRVTASTALRSSSASVAGPRLTAWGGFTGATTPAGPGPVFVFAAVCLLAGLGDLSFILRGRLSAVQRLSRHVWRICIAFFIATGSFFLGQQDVLPAAWQRSPFLLVPAFAPFAVMAFWLVRVRFGRRFRPSLPAAPEGSPA